MGISEEDFRVRDLMGTERKRKVSLFDVVDDSSVSKLTRPNGGGAGGNNNNITMPLINRWNGRPYSQRYHDILEKRKTLPVWQQKEEFFKVLKANQTLILVGETGSGKTTQVSNLDFSLLIYLVLFSGFRFFGIFIKVLGDE